MDGCMYVEIVLLNIIFSFDGEGFGEGVLIRMRWWDREFSSGKE